MTSEPELIHVGHTDDGDPFRLPIEDVLTGRLFVTGKSGAGKSNTGSVIAEELLDRGLPLLIVDVDGEYWGLKEDYEVLHVGATQECDLRVGPEHAAKLAQLGLEQHVSIILDLSGYVDQGEAETLLEETARELFAREQQALAPFLILVEEIHEFIPQSGGLGSVGEILIRIAKRGRKRGLGIAGLSQRPADVRKDFITQADLLVWHRLTWDNDTDVVKRVVGAEHADLVRDLDDGQAFVQADWTEADVELVQFRRKHTFDAGATPTLGDVERPELKSIGEDLLDELESISQEHDQRQDRLHQLETKLEQREDEIASLQDELDDARDLQRIAEALVDALSRQDADVAEVDTELLAEKNQEIRRLREERDDLEGAVKDLAQERNAFQDKLDRLRSLEERVDRAEWIEDRLEDIQQWLYQCPLPRKPLDRHRVDVELDDVEDPGVLKEQLQGYEEEVQRLKRENEQLRSKATNGAGGELANLLEHGAVQAAITVAKENSDRASEHFDRVLAVLNSSGGGPLTSDKIAPLTEASRGTVNKVLRDLFDAGVVRRSKDGQSYKYSIDQTFLERRIQVHELDQGGGR